MAFSAPLGVQLSRLIVDESDVCMGIATTAVHALAKVIHESGASEVAQLLLYRTRPLELIDHFEIQLGGASYREHFSSALPVQIDRAVNVSKPLLEFVFVMYLK